MKPILLFLMMLISVGLHAETLSITDGQSGDRYPGKFVWTDLVSHDPERAAEFYSRLFGWDIGRYGEQYQVIRNGGRPIAGIVQNQADDSSQGNQWISYVSVGDFDGAHKRLTDAGAEVILAPTVLDSRGQFGVYSAPDGAVFGVLKSADGDPAEQPAEIGDWIWIELWSKNTTGAAAFYAQLGYDVEKNWASANDNDQLLSSGGFVRAGIVEGHPEQKKSAWLLYVRVQDVGEAQRKATALGGKVLDLGGELKKTGDISLIEDPTGGIVAVYALQQAVSGQGE